VNGGCVALGMSTRGGSPGDPADAKRSRSSVGSQGATFTRRLRRAAIGRCLEARLRFAPGASSTDRGSRRPYRPPDGGLPVVTRAPRLAKSAVGVPGARYVHGWPARAWISSRRASIAAKRRSCWARQVVAYCSLLSSLAPRASGHRTPATQRRNLQNPPLRQAFGRRTCQSNGSMPSSAASIRECTPLLPLCCQKWCRR